MILLTLLEKLQNSEAKLAVVGLGYVGMPLAVAYAEHFSVIGFDSNEKKIGKYLQGIDPTDELDEGALEKTSMEFTSDPSRLSEASFIIIAVPTPINGDKTPDLEPLKGASATVGKYLSRGSVVVYESTVYPGVTEEVCCPILEKESGLKCGVDFKIGYSPERINPGDKVHRLRNITKIVSGMDKETLDTIAGVYGIVIDEVYPAPTIKVAEAAKLVENSQRDINIAFMNELAKVFHLMDIDTNEVFKAMNTKWNALGFKPGLVGGHCIGVDPYYFIYKAQNLGYYSQMISVGRRINNGMVDFVVQETLKMMVQGGMDVSRARICLMGMTFKEDCPDTRNSRAIDIYRKMNEYGLNVFAVDPMLDKAEFERYERITLLELTEVKDMNCLVFLVAHKEFCGLEKEDIRHMLGRDGKTLIMDVKNIFARQDLEDASLLYWNL
ncbi:MAG: nucleotide sugar dehydrogenase [Selenomonas sp.]|nr:nucleotide sugar dehydrogenase [Selenomonas sp.]